MWRFDPIRLCLFVNIHTDIVYNSYQHSVRNLNIPPNSITGMQSLIFVGTVV